MEKEDLLHCLNYVKEHFEGFVGIKGKEEEFFGCLSEIYKFIKRNYSEDLVILTKNESIVLCLRSEVKGEKPLTLKKIGELLNVSSSRISQIEAKAIRKIRKNVFLKNF